MTFQPCRPATIKLLPYGGAPFGNTCFFIVRRIGVTKPPVQLGVGKNTLV